MMRERAYRRVVYDTAVQLRMTRDLREAIELAAAAQNKSLSRIGCGMWPSPPSNSRRDEESGRGYLRGFRPM